MREIEHNSIPQTLVILDLLGLVQVGGIDTEEDSRSSVSDSLDVSHEVGILLLSSSLRIIGGSDQKMRGDYGRRLNEERVSEGEVAWSSKGQQKGAMILAPGAHLLQRGGYVDPERKERGLGVS